MPKHAKHAKSANPAQAGFNISDWCAATTVSRASLYKLPSNEKPHSVKLQKRRIILESPGDWLARMAAAQRGAWK